MERPPVSLVVPFGGPMSELEGLIEAVAGLELGDDDETLIVDNSIEQLAGAHVVGRPRLQIVAAPLERSSYYARNLGAETSRNRWLLFMDADCRPRAPNLLDELFRLEIAHDVGAVAGAVIGDPGQRAFTSRYSRARKYMDQAAAVGDRRRPFAATAHLLVRKEAWRQVGGFCEGIRSGGDREFCWRLARAGWKLGLAPSAVVEHRHRTTLRALLRLRLRYGASAGWLVRRESATFMRPFMPYWIARALVAAGVHAMRGRRERAGYSVIDFLIAVTWCVGYVLENRSPAPSRGARPRSDAIVLLECFPDRGQWGVEAVRALQRDGVAVRIEAAHRSQRPEPWTARGLDVHYLEDDGFLRTALLKLLRVEPRLPRSLAARRERIRRAHAMVVGEDTPPDLLRARLEADSRVR